MNVKSFFIRCILILFLIAATLTFTDSPAYALPPAQSQPGQGPVCKRPKCTGLSLGSVELAIDTPLIVDFGFANPDQFVTDIPGASSDPKDIVQLVEDAITVWRAAFKEIPDIDLDVGWADFGVLKKINQSFLSGSLVGGIQQPCDGPNDQALGLPVPTELPAVAGDILGLHICGSGIDDITPLPCIGSEAKKATILFNSELLKMQQPDQGLANVKLFLDTNPFESSAFGPIANLGKPERRLTRSFDFSDPYVVDLFTVALHEVGHALGYSEGNKVSPAHIGDLEIPDVLNPYLSFSTRKCPSRADVQGLIAVGPPIPLASSSGYQLVSEDPCGSMAKGQPPNNRPANKSPERFNWLKFIILLLVAMLIGAIAFLLGKRQSQSPAGDTGEQGREQGIEPDETGDEN
jgi:hypothetical protein